MFAGALLRLTRIYTKIGDKGTTGLANGNTVSKSSLRIEAYGTVDELNAVVGLLKDELALCKVSPTFEKLGSQLRQIQNELFDLGGELATPLADLRVDRQQVISMTSVERLEQELDEYNASLEPLTNFVLPGGVRVNSIAHLARTVCRRAERCIVALGEAEPLRNECRVYLNRLSDWYFVVSRTISKELGVPELLWQQQKKK